MVVRMRDRWCVLVPLLVLAGSSLQVEVKSGKETENARNVMEDEQWLSTISQYSRKINHWNRFRDVSLQCKLLQRCSLIQ
ncbi:UNVERIFIED_CONTAM: hypothetical protein FKN15_022186 [Acipenser sinensis]